MKKITAALLMGLLALVLTASFIGCGTAETEPASYRQISQEEAARLMQSEKDYVILDVRREDEFREKHIVGAINIPNEAIDSEPIAQLPDKDRLIMVYCRSGNRSKQASEKLVKFGYTNVVEFGGIITWSGETVSGND